MRIETIKGLHGLRGGFPGVRPAVPAGAEPAAEVQARP